MEKLLEMTRWACTFGGLSLRESPGGMNSIILFDGDSDMALPVPAEGGFSKETMISASPFLWEKAADSILTMKPDN